MLSLDMSLLHLGLAGMVMLLAAYTQGLTGQGFAQLAAPLMLLFMEPRLVVPLNLTLASVVCLSVMLDAPAGIRLRPLIAMAITSLIGAPVGAHILLIAGQSILKVIVGIAAVGFAIPLLMGSSCRLRHERMASAGVGFLAGVLAGSTSASGPPVVLFLVNQGWPKEVLRPSFCTFFLFSNLVALTAIVLSGGATSQVWTMALYLLPVVLVGFHLGTRTLSFVDAVRFQQLSLLVVLAAGLTAIVSEAGRLL